MYFRKHESTCNFAVILFISIMQKKKLNQSHVPFILHIPTWNVIYNLLKNYTILLILTGTFCCWRHHWYWRSWFFSSYWGSSSTSSSSSTFSSSSSSIFSSSSSSSISNSSSSISSSSSSSSRGTSRFRSGSIRYCMRVLADVYILKKYKI